MSGNFFGSGRLPLINFILVIVALVGLPVVYVLSNHTANGSASASTQLVADNSNSPQVNAVLASENNTPPVTGYLPQSFRGVAAAVLPVVVEVNVVDLVKQNVQQMPSPFDFFFGNPNQQRQAPQTKELKQYGLGSGVIVKKTGNTVYVLTNNHVAGNASQITVKLYDGRKFTATLVGHDPNKDLALIKFTTSEKIPVAQLGDSTSLRPGDWVLAVGNPLGFRSTVTAGIVSAVGREPAGGAGSHIATLTDYIQTDAAINRGNSGGALVNLQGQVVGINTWIASPSGGSVGIGFAIPINNAKQAINDFIKTGHIRYGWFGINISQATPDMQSALGIGNSTGGFVNDVFVGSPAYNAGIHPGDFITKVGNHYITDSSHLLYAVSDLAPGTRIPVTLLREGRTLTVTVDVGTRQNSSAIQNEAKKLWPGMTVVPLTADVRSQLNLTGTQGKVVIGAVENSTPAQIAGLQVGDVVLKVNGKDVGSLKQFYGDLSAQQHGDVMFSILRNGTTVLLGLTH